MRQENQKTDSQNSGQKAKDKLKEKGAQKGFSTTNYLIIGLIAAIGLGYSITYLSQPASQSNEMASNEQEEVIDGAKYGALSHTVIKNSLPELVETNKTLEQTADNSYSVSTTPEATLSNEDSKEVKEVKETNEVEPLKTLVNRQLEALNDKNIAKAYKDFTSDEFKQATSYDAYSQIVKDYPILSDHAKVEFDPKTIVIDKNRATISATIFRGKDSIMVDYSLVKAGNEWKIWGQQIKEANPDNSAVQEHSPEEKEVFKSVETVFNLFKSNDVAKAYKDYTTSEFQKITPLSTFQVFVSNYPVLTRFKTITFGDVTFDDDKASLTANLVEDQKSNPVEFTLIRTGNQWKIFGLRVLVADQGKISTADKGEIQAVIDEQLSAIRSNNFEKAYTFNSKEFREATSSQSFQEFVKHYPFFQYTSVSYSNPVQSNQTVSVLVTFSSQSNNADVEYRLLKEDGEWKIWTVNVVRNAADAAARPSSIKSEELQNTIQGQLAAARKNEFSKAYQTYTSKAFKESTSLSSFQSFLDKNPVLVKNAGATFGNLSFENDIGTYAATLVSSDGDTEPVNYRLVYEDNGWKILSINILYSQQPAIKSLEFTKVVVGTVVDSNGMIKKPLKDLETVNDKITANVYIHNAVQGSKIEALLEHVDTASRINPASTTLDKNGDSVVSFVFTPPAKGWPKGAYKLTVTSSTGANTTYTFTVK